MDFSREMIVADSRWNRGAGPIAQAVLCRCENGGTEGAPAENSPAPAAAAFSSQ